MVTSNWSKYPSMIGYQSGYDGRDLGNYAAQEYNSRTQLIRENHEAHFRKLDGRDWTYRYDDAGNRLEEKNDGVIANDYNVSNNRYSSITREPGAWVRGSVSSQGNEEVFLYAQEKAQSQAPERAGRYFSGYFDYSGTSINRDLFKAIVMDNGDTNVAEERINIPPASESPAYDGNGNLTASWAYDFKWDAGDRLIKVSPKNSSGFARSGAKAYTYEMRYDYMDRMVELVVNEHTGNGSIWSPGTEIRDLRFVYRGWDMVLEIDKSSKESLRGYAWGLDLSGAMGGAGGTRGLLGVTELVGTHKTYFPAYDAMGHIYAMVDDVTGETAAEYEYDPYGKLIRSSGSYADINPFGYSTHYSLREIDLVYYGYRFYDPEHGRFLNKDPIGEAGGNNLYAAFGNDPVNRIDVLGLNPRGSNRKDKKKPDKSGLKFDWGFGIGVGAGGTLTFGTQFGESHATNINLDFGTKTVGVTFSGGLDNFFESIDQGPEGSFSSSSSFVPAKFGVGYGIGFGWSVTTGGSVDIINFGE